jgi:hypothetical protein
MIYMHSGYEDRYKDYNPDSFIIKARRTVYKWWCVVYKPVYKLTHNGRWPEEKNPENVYPASVPISSYEMADMAAQAVAAVDNISVEQGDEKLQEPESEIDLTGVDSDTLDKANEIMARLAKEAADDEAKKQSEIDAARKEAQEREKLAIIMKANKVDIAPFIEEGKAHRSE